MEVSAPRYVPVHLQEALHMLIVNQSQNADFLRLLEHGDIIDTGAFNQIIEMDDDGDNEFSRSIVYDFFEQAESTFEKMKQAM
jgi:hypothetical protein